MGQIEEAKSNFYKAIDLNSNFANAYYNLSEIKNLKKDELFNKMYELYINKNLTEKESCLINFALAKANEDLHNFEQSFLHYSKGNELRKKILNYDLIMMSNYLTRLSQILN